MEQKPSFGKLIKEHRRVSDLTQAELARRVGCATITLRKIEANSLRPSVQIAERLAMMLNIPMEERANFVRLARTAHLDTPEPPPTPTPPPLPDEIGGEDLSGRAVRGYDLGERIGSGGYGAVYLATQKVINRQVAVKIILPQYANHPDFIRRFEAEAQLVARLEHPHIVPLYDYWREPNAAFLVMRLMRGGSLKDLIGERPLTLEFTLRVLGQIGDALYTAHRSGVIHRDLKPANILLDEDKNAYLADFGVAKDLGDPDWDEITKTGDWVSSPAYVSPEQVRTEALRPQADIYCLGVLVYEMLTGELPFRGPTPMDFITQHLNDPLPTMTKWDNGLPLALDQVLERATAKDPLGRYTDIPQFLKEFYAAIDYTPAVPQAGIEFKEPESDIDPAEIGNPYKGLRPFLEADEDDFYGRETLVQDLLGRLGEERDLARFLAVVGPSGSGKSSVVKAGLIPALRRGALPGSEKWFVVDFMPGANPLEELEAALLRIAVNPPESLIGQLQEDTRGLLRAIRRVLPADESVELVLAVDQFEEIYTLLEDEAERVHFMESLVTAVLDPRSRLRVVITLRADFTDRPLLYMDFGDLVRMRTEFVLPLTPDELELAITGPAYRVGLVLEHGLVARIVRDVGDQPGALPLLQYALTEMFERREGRRMTLKGYESSGGVLGALGRRAEAIYTQFDEPTQVAARQVFIRLVTLGEGVEDTRRRVTRSEISGIQVRSIHHSDPKIDPRIVDLVIGSYGHARLFSFDHDPVTRGPTLEVSHEALLREWPRLRGWLDESRDDIRSQRILTGAARDWAQNDSDPSYLLRGARLDQYAAWAADTELALTADERAFLDAGLHAQTERLAAETERQAREAALEKRSRRFLQALVAVLAVATVVALGLTLFALRQARIAKARELTAAAALNLESDPELSILLSNEAIDTWSSAYQEIPPDLQGTLHQAVQNARAINTWNTTSIILGVGFDLARNAPLIILSDPETGVVRVWDPQGIRDLLAIHDQPVSSGYALASLTTDGKWAAVPHADKVVRVYSLETGETLQELTVETEILYGVKFSPDGRLLAAFGQDYLAVWDIALGEVVLEPEIEPGTEFLNLRMDFSADGSRLVLSSLNNTFRVIDTDSGEIVAQPSADYNIDISYVAISPDGNRVAAGGLSDSIQVWDLSSGEPGQTLNLWHNAITQDGMVFSPDGNLFAYGLQSGVMIWDVAQDKAHITLSGRLDVIKYMAFSPGGNRLLTTSADGKVTLWDLSPSHESAVIEVLDPKVESPVVRIFPAFHPDGTQIAASVHNFGIKIIDLLTEKEIYRLTVPGEEGLIYDLSYSPDGKFLAAVRDTGYLEIWDSSTGELHRRLTDYGEDLLGYQFDRGLHAVAFSSLCDTSPGKVCPLATVGTDGQLIVWDAQTGEQIFKYQNEDALTALAYSPDGKLLAFGNAQMKSYDQGVVKVLDLETRTILQEWTGILGWVFGMDFSPDGKHLAVGTTYADFRIMDVGTGETVHDGDSTAAIIQLAYTPDGKSIVTTEIDSTHYWDAASGESLYTLADSPVFSLGLSISADGSKLAVGTDRLYIYILDMDELAALGRKRLTRSFTLDECQKYLHLEKCPEK